MSKGTFQERLAKAMHTGDKLTLCSYEQEKWEIRIENEHAKFGALQRTVYVFKEETTPGKLLDAIESASMFLHDCVETMAEAQAAQPDAS